MDHRTLTSRAMLAVAAVILLSACSQPPPTSRSTAPNETGARAAAPNSVSEPKGTIKLAWAREPDNLNPKFIAGGGAGDYTWLFSSALAVRDIQYVPHPMIARELPTQENGDWVINPDGSMVTTYHLR